MASSEGFTVLSAEEIKRCQGILEHDPPLRGYVRGWVLTSVDEQRVRWERENTRLQHRILLMRERLEQDLIVIEGTLDELIAAGKSVHDDQGANFLAGHAQTIRHVLELPHRVYPEAES